MKKIMLPSEEVFVWTGVRYALGRMSYVVSMVTEEVVRLWPELTKSTKEIIQRDVEDGFAKGGNYLGMDMDKKQWETVRALWQPKA